MDGMSRAAAGRVRPTPLYVFPPHGLARAFSECETPAIGRQIWVFLQSLAPSQAPGRRVLSLVAFRFCERKKGLVWQRANPLRFPVSVPTRRRPIACATA